jgi:NAD(P)-dependent dehydrogenase (short-subunit alcohol dehydrogenase family)
MEHVEGKTAFITGGANGIGFGMAKAFVRAGMKVTIADVRQDHLDRAMAHFGNNPNVHAIRLDVTDREAMKRAADEVERVFNKVHVVCNNAGVMAIESGEPTYDDWDWMLGVNLGGVVNGVTTFVPRIKKHGEGGHIVNTASMNAFLIGPGANVYITSKFAVRGLTEALRVSLFPFGIGVSMLCPGVVNTGLDESQATRPQHLARSTAVDPKVMAGVKEVMKLGMDPEQVGELVLKAIQRGQFYIFTTPGFKEEIREISDEILAAMPEGEGDPRLAEFERGRRELNAKAKGQHV